MTKKLHSNARMSQVVVHNGIAYLSGQIATGLSIEEQTRAIFSSIEALLADAGSSKASMLSATIWLTDMADFAAFNMLWEAWLEGIAPPARATTQAALAAPDYRVEIAVIAACSQE